MKHPMKLLMNSGFGLLLMALMLFSAPKQAFAGGGFLSVHIDSELKNLMVAAQSAAQLQPALLANGNPTSAYALPRNPLPECPVHSTRTPHDCNNPDYAHVWNPAQRMAVEESAQTNSPQIATGNLSHHPRGILPAQFVSYSGENDHMMQYPGWTKIGVIEDDETWLQAFGNDPNYMRVDLPTNLQRWVVFQRDVAWVEERAPVEPILGGQAFDTQPIQQIIEPITILPTPYQADPFLLDAWMDQVQIAAEVAQPTHSEISEVEIVAEAAKQASPPVAASLKLSAWPNPTMDIVKVQMLGDEESRVEYRVLDGHGLLVRQVARQGNETPIDLTGLAAGTYFLHARLEGAVLATTKVVLVR